MRRFLFIPPLQITDFQLYSFFNITQRGDMNIGKMFKVNKHITKITVIKNILANKSKKQQRNECVEF